MSNENCRLASGGRITRSKPLNFTFDGRRYQGFEGDTLASALIANGVKIVARSFKYHRPRGVYAASVDEPNALVTLRTGARREPNIQATMIELYEGLIAAGQNCWPSLELDLMIVIDWLSPFLAAGFYYKTMMGPTRKAWMFYEYFIRHAAGMGMATMASDPDQYEKVNEFCDVMIVGAGPAGISAACAAAESGAKVFLVEQSSDLGGALLSESVGAETDEWLKTRIRLLENAENLTVLKRTTVYGAYDHGIFGLLERVSDHLDQPLSGTVRQRMWIIRVGQTILATGALERPIVFSGNDLPGIMLAGAARCYLNKYGVLPGKKVVVFTNNDSAYQVAIDLAEAGAKVTLTEARSLAPATLKDQAESVGVKILASKVVLKANGRKLLHSVNLAEFDADTSNVGANRTTLLCDLLCVSGGWSPTLHLLLQRSARPVFDSSLATFVPGETPPGFIVAGAATGCFDTQGCLQSGREAGTKAALLCGFETGVNLSTSEIKINDAWEQPLLPLWEIPGKKEKKAFVDLQHDVTTADIELAHREGYESVEHLKRYTTLGMATDQGKMSNILALALMADHRGVTVPEVGHTTFRPPFTPIAIGAVAGRQVGADILPRRLTPMHDWVRRNGAKFLETGIWDRAWYFPKPGEDLEAAYVREAAKVRNSVGIIDVSTLGKIDVQGPDAAEFLNRVYVNEWKTLAVNKARYGIMLREDGMVFDDGTTTRISDYHYFMTTTTASAELVMSKLEYLLQTTWSDLKVQVTSVTDQWAALAISGPRARDVLERLVDDINVSNEALPFMGTVEGMASGIPVRIIRITFTGELGYEIYTPAGYGEELWDNANRAGKKFDLSLFGIEALGALRIEKGHVAGSEINGRTSLDDLGFGRMESTKKSHIGKVLSRREALLEPERLQFVGLKVIDPKAVIKGGSLLFEPGKQPKGHGLGFLTAVAFSPAMKCYIALGLLAGGRAREGNTMNVVDAIDNTSIPVQVSSPHFYDPQGEKARA